MCQQTRTPLCEIQPSQSNEYEIYGPLGCNAKEFGNSVISRGITVVSVFMVYLMIPEMKDYTLMYNWRTVNGDTGRTLTVVVLR